MSGPISGNYTPAEMQILTDVWENLPTANNVTLQADIQKLGEMAKSHPELAQIVNVLNQAAGDKSALQTADNASASELYPQLPNILPQNMANALNSIANSLDTYPSNDILGNDMTQLQSLLAQAKNIQPPSPQSQTIISQIQNVIGAIQEKMSTGMGIMSDAANALRFLLPHQ